MYQSRNLLFSHPRIILLSHFGLKGLVPCYVRGLDILSEEITIDTHLVHFTFFFGGGGVGGALIRGWALINFSYRQGGSLFEVGAYSRLGA